MNKITSFIMATGFALALAGCSSTKTSQPVTLTTPLDNSAWNGSQWISVVNAPTVIGKVKGRNERAADGANWFVSTIKNEKKVVSAKWMTTGLGVYDLYINGRLIGDEILKPGFTHREKTKRSFTYDITGALTLKSGAENQLAVQVTPGWWADKIVTPGGHDGMIGKKCAFRGVVELTFADGSTKLYPTNLTDWKAGITGPVKHAAIFDGEDYDARLPMGYEATSNFAAPEENNEFKGEILPDNGAEIYFRDDIALAPAKAYKYNKVEGANDSLYGKVVVDKEYAAGEEMVINPGDTLVIDFGQNCSAVPEFVFSAKTGTKLTCLPGELLNDGNGAKKRGMDGPEGSVHRLNLRIPDYGMQLFYTFPYSKEAVTFRPRNTFYGYRFVEITANDEVRIQKILSVPVTSITKDMEIGTITTGNDLINQLISNTLWGQRSNYLSVPTDCPQRNERLGWMADTQVFTETGSFFANTDRFFHKWTHDVRDTQSEKGGFAGVSPVAQYGADATDKMRVGWADAGIIVPWVIWKQFADKSMVDENWDAMEKFMNHVNETKYDHLALKEENGDYQWADWLSYEPLESCSGRAFKDGGKQDGTYDYWNYLNASYWAMDAGLMRDMAKATGRDAQKYETMMKNAKQYILDTFFTPEGTFKTEILNTMQTPALFALKNNLFEGEKKAAIIKRLRQNFADHGNCLQTGFLGTSILMTTLTENGCADIAYELLFQRKNPSWLYSVDNGATTIWERWNSYMKDKGMGPQGMNSFNHYAYGAVCEWIWKTCAGIAADVENPGFKHIIMRPIPDKRLGSLKAEYNSAAGVIKSEWNYDGDKWTWTFTVPEGSIATVTLPGETQSKDYNAGTYTLEKTL